MPIHPLVDPPWLPLAHPKLWNRNPLYSTDEWKLVPATHFVSQVPEPRLNLQSQFSVQTRKAQTSNGFQCDTELDREQMWRHTPVRKDTMVPLRKPGSLTKAPWGMSQLSVSSQKGLCWLIHILNLSRPKACPYNSGPDRKMESVTIVTFDPIWVRDARSKASHLRLVI